MSCAHAQRMPPAFSVGLDLHHSHAALQGARGLTRVAQAMPGTPGHRGAAGRVGVGGLRPDTLTQTLERVVSQPGRATCRGAGRRSG
eukprot:1653940-Pleurochrysis_carterae.AAC.6